MPTNPIKDHTVSANDWIESRYKRFAREFMSSRPNPDPHRMGLMTEREWKRLESARAKLGLTMGLNGPELR